VPQFVTVVVAVSQPFLAFPSQLPKPALHVGTQAPAVHTVVPLGFVHASPHPPQCGTEVWVLVSQPLFGLLSQLPKPELHVGVHVPLGHVVVPFVFVHCVPQVPQFVTVLREASQPFETRVSQLPKFALQAIEHAPRAQLGVPLLLLQVVPHDPQFATLICVFTSQPFAPAPSQLPKPEEHAPSAQVPEAQDSAAFARSQTAPQVPQLDRVVRLVSHPFAALPSQLPKFVLQLPS
jgi:hypothetical protein